MSILLGLLIAGQADIFCEWVGSSATASNWEKNSKVEATAGQGTITACSSDGRTLLFRSGKNTGMNGYRDNDLCVGNMKSGDFFLFEIPVSKLKSGVEADFFTSLSSRGDGSPRYWLFEYFDKGVWNCVDDGCGSLKTLPDGTRYSFSIINSAKMYQMSSLMVSFRLRGKICSSSLKMRLRAVGDKNVGGTDLQSDSTSFVFLPSNNFIQAQCRIYSDAPRIRDTKKIGWIGNSFTFFSENPMLVKRIARSQGHQILGRISHKGGRTFAQHLALVTSRGVIDEGGYDYFIIQDQSNAEALLGDDPEGFSKEVFEPARDLGDRIKKGSPEAKVILECTWAYRHANTAAPEKYRAPFMGLGGFEAMDAALLKGCALIRDNCPGVDIVSPIASGFAAFRALYPDFYSSEGKLDDKSISLYKKNDDSTADHHPNLNGAYLKACINYLIIYGEPFRGKADDCGVEPSLAARLRKIAEETVLGKQGK